MKFQCSYCFSGILSIRNISYLLPMCCSFWEKCINSQKTGQGCSTPLTLPWGQFFFYFSVYHDKIRLKKKKKNAMSQSSWQIGRPDLNAFFFPFFFFFFFFFLSSKRVRFESVILKYGTWLDFGWTRYKARTQELKKFVVQSVLYFLTSKS